MKSVLIPDYAADWMLRSRPNSGEKVGAREQSLKRTYRLVSLALEDLRDAQWRINGEPKLQSKVLDEFYGLERFEHGFCIYGSERGIPRMLAIFEDDHLAAKYFVWVVSKGQRTIDWTKFMEMEP
jgi:hypothetical protein